MNIPSKTGRYDFGLIKVGKSSPAITFTIENLGITNLNLTASPKIQISGTDSSMFTVNQNMTTSPITPGKSTIFTLTFHPTRLGVKTAQISIANNDSDENPYTFTILGKGKVFDFNGDGFDDVVVGAEYDDDGGDRSGCAFIFFGSFNLSSVIDASKANVKLIGEDTDDIFGGSVSCAGDVNNDGYDDVIVGASHNDDGGRHSGSAYIFFGCSNPASIIDASNADVKFIGEYAGDKFGCSVSGADDVNKDGYDDVIVGAEANRTYSGCAFIFFGSSNLPSVIDASNANVKLIGEDAGDMFGCSVSGAGDINDDGYDDVIVGAFRDEVGGRNSGSAFIFFGSANLSSVIDASNANVKLIGEDAGDMFGCSVSGAGDINGDGFVDVIVGADGDDLGGQSSGSAYIFFGSSNLPSVIDASNANVTLIGEGEGDSFGESVSSAGDMNGDGYYDVIVGSSGNDNSGCSFLFFGSSNMPFGIDASNANVKLIGEDEGDSSGYSVSGAGDINGDGHYDVIVGAYSDDDGGEYSGCAFIFYGNSNMSSIIDASNADVKFIGEDEGDRFGCSVSGGK